MSRESSIVSQLNDALRSKEQYLRELEGAPEAENSLRYEAAVRSIDMQVAEDLCITGIGQVLRSHPLDADISNIRFHPVLNRMTAEQIAAHTAVRLPIAS